MNSTIVLDAHALLWFLEGNPKLSIDCRQRLSDPQSRLLIPAISLAETCWVISKGKSRFTVEQLRQAIVLDSRVSVIPLDEELVYAAFALKGELEMHDRMIVATAARELSGDPTTVLLTEDAEIRASKIVPTIW